MTRCILRGTSLLQAALIGVEHNSPQSKREECSPGATNEKHSSVDPPSGSEVIWWAWHRDCRRTLSPSLGRWEQ